MVGPVFFMLLETSIRKGIRAGIAFDMGVIISDIIYILIAFLFYNEVKSLAEGESRETARVIGGLLFIGYGIFTFFKKPVQIQFSTSITKEREPANWKEYRMLCLKGFFLNLANPFVIFYWFSVLSYGDANNVHGLSSKSTLLIFIGVILATFVSMDVLKVLGAKQMRPFITNKLLKSLNQLLGAVFVAFGLVLIAQGIIKNM